VAFDARCRSQSAGANRDLEEAHRGRRQEGDAFREADREGLRRQLADHDVQERDGRERDRDRRVLDHARRLDAERGEDRREEMREGRLADPAEAQAGQRDPELGGREEDVEAPVERGREARLPVAFGRQGLHPRRPHPHHGELRSNEEGVHHDEAEGERDEQGVGDHPQRARARGEDARGTTPGEASAGA